MNHFNSTAKSVVCKVGMSPSSTACIEEQKLFYYSNKGNLRYDEKKYRVATPKSSALGLKYVYTPAAPPLGACRWSPVNMAHSGLCVRGYLSLPRQLRGLLLSLSL